LNGPLPAPVPLGGGAGTVLRAVPYAARREYRPLLRLGGLTVSGFNAGVYIPVHPRELRPTVEAALKAVAAGLADTEVDVLPFWEAVTAHERMESRALNGRIVLRPQ
jgi:NADPH:quinone reductase-like Zn-dependent oxidoreductase